LAKSGTARANALIKISVYTASTPYPTKFPGSPKNGKVVIPHNSKDMRGL